MRKFTLTLVFLFVSAMIFAQTYSPANEAAPASATNNSTKASSAKGNWTVQFTYPVFTTGTAGCETDGVNFYVARWNTDSIFKYSLTGTYISKFSVPGVSGLRDLAYDGHYLYGGKATNLIYKMKFDTTVPSLIGQITTPVVVRNICYNPAANSGAGGFWVGNWATDLVLVSRTGSTLATIPAATHGLLSTYGTAYDNVTPGGPYIWAISAGSPANTTIFQISVATGMQTGLSHDVTTDITAAGNLGGGLWIQPNIVAGTVTLGGLIQNDVIFGYDLASVIPDTFDISVSSLNIPNLVPIGQNVNIQGSVENNGLSTITAFHLNYSIDGGAAVTQNVTGVSIPSYTSYSFTHSTAWMPTSGFHNIKVWTSSPNGHADQNMSNDTLASSATGYNPSSSVQRMPLYETFTSSTCAPCVAGNINMQGLYANNPNKYVAIKYQMSWPGNGDPYYTLEGYDRRVYYNVSSVPHQFIDGGYDGNSSSVLQSDFDAAYSNPAFVDMSASLVMDTVTHHFTVGVYIDPKIDLPASARLFVGIVEKHTSNNVGTNGETDFYWVMKKMMPDGNGKVIGPKTAGTGFAEYTNYKFNGNYRLPANALSPINNATENSVEEFSDVIAVCWIQNYSTKEVYQSCYSSVTLGIADQHPEDIISATYPNPASDIVNFNIKMSKNEKVALNIVTASGQKIKDIDFGIQNTGVQKLSVDISTLESGVYFFKFNVGGAYFMKPVMIK